MESDWQLKCKNLNQRIGYMFKSGQWTDCTFLVGLKPEQAIIECHRNILASASPVFAAMFYGQMAERQSPIPIPDIGPEAFRAMLTYIYAEQDFKISSFDEGCNLYYAANKYDLPFIKDICIKYIKRCLDHSFKHIFQVYEFASLYDKKTLMNECLQIMSNLTRQILEDKCFIEAQVSSVVAIFSLERISCLEETLYTALMRYLKTQKVQEERRIMEGTAKSHTTDCSKRCIENSADDDRNDSSGPLKDAAAVKVENGAESCQWSHSQGGRSTESEEKSVARVLLEKIRFLTMRAETFALGPANSGLLTDLEAYAILMNIVTTKSHVPMPSGFSTSRAVRSQRIN